MTRRYRRRRREERSTVLRVAAGVARVVLVVLASMAVGYAFYSALQWAEAERRDSASVFRAIETTAARSPNPDRGAGS